MMTVAPLVTMLSPAQVMDFFIASDNGQPVDSFFSVAGNYENAIVCSNSDKHC